MPTIFEPRDLPTTEKSGVNITTLANRAMLGTDALQVQRVTLSAGAKSELYAADNAERFLYVVHGKGQVHVSEHVFSLDAESVVWLEKGDAYLFEADTDGLEVLLCHAPAGE